MNGLISGASEIISNAEKFSLFNRFGSFPSCGITIACPWIIMDGVLSKSQRFSSRQD
jgi:hypothetical protein